eukprot:CAMPEP_0118931812 /NCGR_PEP_ID=MMETSP1169-20130426/8020_1 /TAXON_ID=36882 /ORGANISM="Pyramimonas obovata, Strain CCMP722" /LENGTH=85 /DNA_ID=CAMNT_0006874355 /DNA_START=67 /DNA_END=320 /DNA_ORIENTATION=+
MESLVRETLKKLEPVQDGVAELFFRKLRRVYPTERFSSVDIERDQGGSLLKLLDTAVETIHNTHALMPTLEEFARHLAHIGVTEG